MSNKQGMKRTEQNRINIENGDYKYWDFVRINWARSFASRMWMAKVLCEKKSHPMRNTYLWLEHQQCFGMNNRHIECCSLSDGEYLDIEMYCSYSTFQYHMTCTLMNILWISSAVNTNERRKIYFIVHSIWSTFHSKHVFVNSPSINGIIIVTVFAMT